MKEVIGSIKILFASKYFILQKQFTQTYILTKFEDFRFFSFCTPPGDIYGRPLLKTCQANNFSMFTFGVCNVLYNSLGSIFVGQEAVLSFTSNFLLKVNFHGAYGRRVIDIIKNMNYSCTQPWHKLFNPDSRWKMRGHILLHVRVIKIGNMKLPAMFFVWSKLTVKCHE